MKKPTIFLWICLLAVFIVEGAFAQVGFKDFPRGKWWANKRLIADLDLSPDQQTKIDTVWNQVRKNLIDQRAELEKRQLDLGDLLGKESIDEATALKAFDRVQEARLALERATFLMRLQIKNLLSMEQQQKLEVISERLRQQQAKAANAGIPNPPRPAAQPIVPPLKKK
jgi:Spy/CpxP family protein refolding chaperone